MKELVLKFWRAEDISLGVRVLTWVTAIRWIGWGLAESLLPVFLFTFSSTYAQTGLLRSSYDIAYILSLPIIGVLADRMRGTTLILIGLSLYFIVGTGYLLAGLTGMAIFIVIARFVNGIGYGMDAVGRETYLRRHASVQKLASVFGYFDTVTNFWWMLAAIGGIFLVKFVPIHWLLFMIVPTVAISLLIIVRFRRSEPMETFSSGQQNAHYRDLVKEMVAWDGKLKALVTMNFFVSFAYAVVSFFIPIQLYIEGAGYTPIILMGVISAIPPLFGWMLGEWFDRRGVRTFGYGLLLYGILIAMLGFISGYWWQVAIVFFIGVVIELLVVGSNELATTYTNPEHFGRVDGMMRSIATIGGMTGPLIMGIVMDAWGNQVAYPVLALIVFALTVVFMIMARISHASFSSTRV
jgi:MFS family permease